LSKQEAKDKDTRASEYAELTDRFDPHNKDLNKMLFMHENANILRPCRQLMSKKAPLGARFVRDEISFSLTP
jgi:hypothetical protein